MVQREHDRLVIDDVKRMTELTRVANARHLAQVVSVHLEEFHQLARVLIKQMIDRH